VPLLLNSIVDTVHLAANDINPQVLQAPAVTFDGVCLQSSLLQ